VAERLGWGIDPNCTSARGRTPLIANARGFVAECRDRASAAQAGADPTLTDETGFTALDYARRKLAKLQSRKPRRPRKSPSLDENDQLQLQPEEQAELARMRRELGAESAEAIRIWWKERLRAARRVFNDPEQVEKIVAMLEAAGK